MGFQIWYLIGIITTALLLSLLVWWSGKPPQDSDFPQGGPEDDISAILLIMFASFVWPATIVGALIFIWFIRNHHFVEGDVDGDC